MRAIVHIAGRPDADGKQRCVVCRHEIGPPFHLMGRDVSRVETDDGKVLGYSTGDGPPDAISVKCTAL